MLKFVISIFSTVIAISSIAEQYKLKFQATVDVVENGKVVGTKKLKAGTMLEDAGGHSGIEFGEDKTLWEIDSKTDEMTDKTLFSLSCKGKEIGAENSSSKHGLVIIVGKVEKKYLSLISLVSSEGVKGFQSVCVRFDKEKAIEFQTSAFKGNTVLEKSDDLTNMMSRHKRVKIRFLTSSERSCTVEFDLSGFKDKLEELKSRMKE